MYASRVNVRMPSFLYFKTCNHNVTDSSNKSGKEIYPLKRFSELCGLEKEELLYAPFVYNFFPLHISEAQMQIVREKLHMTSTLLYPYINFSNRKLHLCGSRLSQC